MSTAHLENGGSKLPGDSLYNQSHPDGEWRPRRRCPAATGGLEGWPVGAPFSQDGRVGVPRQAGGEMATVDSYKKDGHCEGEVRSPRGARDAMRRMHDAQDHAMGGGGRQGLPPPLPHIILRYVGRNCFGPYGGQSGSRQRPRAPKGRTLIRGRGRVGGGTGEGR